VRAPLGGLRPAPSTSIVWIVVLDGFFSVLIARWNI
jgi:hypothetical protein